MLPHYTQLHKEHIMTVALTARDNTISCISDLYKDIYGVRPHFACWAEYTDEHLQEWLDRLCVEFREQEQDNAWYDYIEQLHQEQVLSDNTPHSKWEEYELEWDRV